MTPLSNAPAFPAQPRLSTNSVLGYTAFRDDEWYVKGEWDAVSGSHDQFVIPRRDIELFEGVSLKAGEKILVIQSRKYDAEEKATLWRKAHLSEVGRWSNEDESYGKQLPTTCSLTLSLPLAPRRPTSHIE